MAGSDRASRRTASGRRRPLPRPFQRQVRKADRNDELFRFIEDWRSRTGNLPAELVFDSGPTTHSILARLNAMDVAFLTLRRRCNNPLLHAAGTAERREPIPWLGNRIPVIRLV